MSRIHMEVEVVQQAIASLRRAIQQMENLEIINLSSVSTWWQGPSAEQFEAEMLAWKRSWESVWQRGQDLVTHLERELAEWQAAAQQLAGGAAVGVAAGAVVGGAAVGGVTGVAVGGAAAAGAAAGTGRGEGGDSASQGGQAPSGEPQPTSTYTPRFDGSKPAPGMDSTYGKPGQVPLDAVVKSTPEHRDPNLYADVINQFAVGNNPRYTPDPRWPNETYCNTFAGDVARAMGHPFPTKAEWGLNPRDRATIAMPDLWRYFTDSKAPIQAAAQGWQEVTVNNLQELEQYINQGKMAVAVTPRAHRGHSSEPAGYGSGQLRIAQAGATNANDISLVQGFGLQRLGQIRIFVHD